MEDKSSGYEASQRSQRPRATNIPLGGPAIKTAYGFAKRRFAGTRIGATIGSIVPGVGTAAGGIAGTAISLIPKALQYSKKLAKGAIIGGIAMLSYGTATFASGLAAVGLTTLLALVITPLALAFFILIINNSAYVVPYSDPIVDYERPAPEVPLPPDLPDVYTTCPIPNGYIHLGSYSGAEVRGHGSNSYWNGWSSRYPGEYFIPPWDIPELDDTPLIDENNQSVVVNGRTGFDNCTFSPDPESMAYHPASTCYHYGYAADAYYPSMTDEQHNLPVYLPYIDTDSDGIGESVSWSVAYSGSYSGGYFAVLSTSAGGHNYAMLLSHLGSIPTNGESGEAISTLYEGPAGNWGSLRHVHIELRIDGVYVRPENYMCR